MIVVLFALLENMHQVMAVVVVHLVQQVNIHLELEVPAVVPALLELMLLEREILHVAAVQLDHMRQVMEIQVVLLAHQAVINLILDKHHVIVVAVIIVKPVVMVQQVAIQCVVVLLHIVMVVAVV